MSIRLVVEVLDHAPAELTAAERLLLAVLAEAANEETRECWPGMDALVHRTGLTERSVRHVFARLAQRGLDPRVPLGSDSTDRPVYACSGRQSVYRIPKFVPRKGGRTLPPSTPERRTHVATFNEEKAAIGDRKGGNTLSERRQPAAALSFSDPQEPSSSDDADFLDVLMTGADGGLVEAVADVLGVSHDHARSVIRDICDRAPEPPRNSRRYVLSAIQREPTRYRSTPTPPRTREVSGQRCRHGHSALRTSTGEPVCPECDREEQEAQTA